MMYLIPCGNFSSLPRKTKECGEGSESLRGRGGEWNAWNAYGWILNLEGMGVTCRNLGMGMLLNLRWIGNADGSCAVTGTI